MPDAQEFKAGDVVWCKRPGHKERPMWVRLHNRYRDTRSWLVDGLGKKSDHYDWIVSESELTAAPRIIDVWPDPLAFAKDYFNEPERWEITLANGDEIDQIDRACFLIELWHNFEEKKNFSFYTDDTIRRLADV